ncbi:MAG: hypothetical protein QOJ62_1788 [Actinomycetota bacterium]|jgi:hypothetical protein|nr:hypothetical protein [Actinomycetota bacterium]
MQRRTLLLGTTLLLTVGMTVATAAAIRYHQQLNDQRGSAPASPTAPSPASSAIPSRDVPPPLSSHSYDLDTGKLHTTVYLTAAASDNSTSTQGRLLITGLIRGATPGIRYRLTGGTCASTKTQRNVWAEGVADSSGTAYLTGREWTLPKDDQYFLTLDPWPADGTTPARQQPGIEGVFLLGQAVPFVGHVNVVPYGGGNGCFVGP